MSKRIRTTADERVVYSSVKFKSIPREKFRIRLIDEETGILKINIEARNSKKQWQSSAGSEGSSTINGIPKGGVFQALRVIIIIPLFDYYTNLLNVTQTFVGHFSSSR